MTMAIAKKCDRCGKYHDIYNDKENPHKINSIIPANANYKNQCYSHKIINLCPDCMNELKKWLENK